jgi:hypothetical protein
MHIAMASAAIPASIVMVISVLGHRRDEVTPEIRVDSILWAKGSVIH